MRQIKTFIVRFYTDTELPENTCGNLQALPGRKTFPFKNHGELLNLLQNLANEEAVDSPMRITQDENESNLPVSEQPTE